MFIRFKKRELRGVSKWAPKECALYAVLVESRREDGKPRQRVVRYLAHIKEKYLEATAHQDSFWARVDWHLNDLGLEGEAREAIERRLLQTVKRPTAADLERLKWERKAIERWWR